MQLTRCIKLATGLALAILLVASVVSPHAQAGEYPMRNCNVPGYPSAPLGPWQPQPAPNTVAVDTCLSGGYFGFRLPGIRQLPGGAIAMFELPRPSAGAQQAIKFTQGKVWFDTRSTGTGGPIWVAVGRSSTTGRPGMLYDPSNRDGVRQSLPVYTDRLGIGLTCGDFHYESFTDCYPTHDTPVMIRGTEIMLTEDVKPSVSVTGGSLLEPGQQSGLRTVTYTASDQESGLSRIDMLLDDDVVAARDLSPRCTYIDFAACPLTDQATFRIDTRVVSDGAHRLTLRVMDASGNQLLLSPAGPVAISNSGGDGSGGSGASSAENQPQLTLRFARSVRRSLAVPFGQRVRISGRLSAAGSSVGAARVTVLERVAGSAERALGTIQTGADGDFTHVLAGGRPSRAVRLGYQTSAGMKYSDTLRLNVRAAASLRMTLRLATLSFSGRVLSRPIPRRGKRIVMQGKASGFAWTTFASVRTGRDGRFRGRYRLAVRRPGVRLRIRVRVPSESGYRYLTYTSPPRVVRVR